MALADIVTPEDVALRSNGTVEADDARMEPYINDVLAEASLYAPCLLADDLSELKEAQARGILCDAVLRRFERDDSPQPGTGLAAESWASGPLSKTINYADNTGKGLPLLTTADRDMLQLICKGHYARARSIPIGIPTVRDPDQAGWNQTRRTG